jgi:hypothetical protein
MAMKPRKEGAGLTRLAVVGFALAVSLGSLIFLVTALGGGRVPSHARAAASSEVTLPPVPHCDQGTPTDVVTLTLRTGEPLAFPPCIWVAAGHPFRIVFENLVTGATDGNGITASVSIYATQDDAVTVEGDGFDTGPGSGAKALFVGDAVSGPDTATYEVDALPAGVYYLQSDQHPDLLYATLTAVGG